MDFGLAQKVGSSKTSDAPVDAETRTGPDRTVAQLPHLANMAPSRFSVVNRRRAVRGSLSFGVVLTLIVLPSVPEVERLTHYEALCIVRQDRAPAGWTPLLVMRI